MWTRWRPPALGRIQDDEACLRQRTIKILQSLRPLFFNVELFEGSELGACFRCKGNHCLAV